MPQDSDSRPQTRNADPGAVTRPLESAARPAPFQIRGSTFNLLTLRVSDPEDEGFFDAIAATLSLAPSFYRGAPIVLDLSPLVRKRGIDLGTFCARLRSLTLAPIGVIGATAEWEQAAAAAGLSVFPSGRGTEASSVRPRSAPLKRPATRLVTQPVRSGQQLYAAEGDLVVIAPVSRGAELLADGNIHVYGPMRGRALAGMSGDSSSRIFCRQLDADLVSIAGVYQVSEQFDPAFLGKSVQIRLDGERLVFDRL